MAAIAFECGLKGERLNDVKLAVSEAVTNAVRHAYREDNAGAVTGIAYVDDGALRIVITDTGGGMLPRHDSPGLGLGLPIMAQVTDALDVVSDGHGTEVHMTFCLPAGVAG
jgi:anti-sigma regulatory factor (Ser/Thr protein kinase)